MTRSAVAPVRSVAVRCYRVPTDREESDGTLDWRSTTMVVVHVEAADQRGLGWTYADAGAAEVVRDLLAGVVVGRDALDLPGAWDAMVTAIRNQGGGGLAPMAVAAVDGALWDLKARLLDLPLATLLGAARAEVPIYGSGGFTSYTVEQLQAQLGGWAEAGIPRVKMKIGRDPAEDPARVRAARRAVGEGVALFVDGNGAFKPAAALALAPFLAEQGVTWFEEPVHHRDLAGTRRVRDGAPRGMEVALGEYVYGVDDALAILRAEAADVLMPDATRCGITGLLQVATLAGAFHLPLSTHCAPALHLHPCAALPGVRHMEWFHDHVRIEGMLLDGVPEPRDGALPVDRSRPGHGLVFREADGERFAI